MAAVVKPGWAREGKDMSFQSTVGTRRLYIPQWMVGGGGLRTRTRSSVLMGTS